MPLQTKLPAVYILTNRKNGTLYTGVTSDLIGRIYQHKYTFVKGFASKYHLKRLVYFELHESMDIAITREKRIKNWNRAWKIELIEKENPSWGDLYVGLLD